MMALLKASALRLRIAYYSMALQNIDPSHEDVPDIVRHLCCLSDQLESLKGQP